MTPGSHVSVTIDLARVRANAERVKRQTGVDVIAVVKADAYGLGAARVAGAVAGVVDGFYVFDLGEARDANLKRFGKPVMALLDESSDPRVYDDAGVRPIVWTVDRAVALRAVWPVLSIDTGQQRFAAEATAAHDILRAGHVAEAMTHASKHDQVETFRELTDGLNLRRHVAGTALLGDVAARFDAVRPGLALYEGAVRITTRLVDARDSTGPAGYGGFVAARHGVILAGYAHGLRPGPCVINGVARRVIEIGMQTSFIELATNDKAGDEVELLGDQVTLDSIANEWRVTSQNVLVQMTGVGVRKYVSA
jgi:alanine racemase